MNTIDEKKDNQKVNDNTKKEKNVQGEKEEEKQETLGEKIVEGRRKKGLTQEKFAELMGCTRQMVSRWELNTSVPRTPKIKKMSTILDISIEELMNGKANSPKNPDGTPVAKSFNYKVVIKRVLITIIVLAAIYALYCGYRLLVLNVITSKVAQYKHANNYYFKMESYEDKSQTQKVEVWYKDGKYKVLDTGFLGENLYNDMTYIDLNNNCSYIINDSQNTYIQIPLNDKDIYENGKYMYTYFPTLIKNEEKLSKNLWLKPNKLVSYFWKNSLFLILNDETIEFSKDTLLPISHIIELKANNQKQLNTNKYYIDLNNVTDQDVDVFSKYTKQN